MKTAIHVHTRHLSPCADDSPDEMVNGLVALGFQAAFITEHDALWSPRALKALQKRHPQILLLPGLEKTFQTGARYANNCHVLALGATDRAFLQVNDPAVWMKLAAKHKCLSVLAHPCRWPGSDYILKKKALPEAIEVHCIHHNAQGTQKAATAAETHRLIPLGSDDAHRVDMIGNFWIETIRPFETAEAFRQLILDGQYENVARQ